MKTILSTRWVANRGFTSGLLVLLALQGLPAASAAALFTPLLPLSNPKILSSAAYPGGQHKAQNLLDNNPRTEFSSDNGGTNTYVEFDFGAPVQVAAFRHVDRNDPATIAASELTFLDAAGSVTTTVPVTHVNQRGGITFQAFATPITAQRVKWRVTALGPQGFGTVGGAEISFSTPGKAESAPGHATLLAQPVPVLKRAETGLVQPLRVIIDFPYHQAADLILRVQDLEPRTIRAQLGHQSIDLTIPAAAAEQTRKISLLFGAQMLVETNLIIRPVHQRVVYIVPHSHTDIGYTEIQTAIEEKQVNNLLQGIAYARKTADYPEGARFVWNVEVLWAADLYLRRLSPAQREDFLAAVKQGQVALNGMYLNELTGLCRPEELLQLFRFSTQLADRCGVTIDSAMISDVPGYTWGTVTAMAQAGIKYFSTAPNYFDRIGDILVQWENKPFYWLSPSGKEKVLVWIPYMGYALSHVINQLTPQFVEDYQLKLEATAYPYDIAYLRWSGHGDNAVPDPAICEFVKTWNSQYAWPRFVISSTSEAFRGFEQRYGNQLPQVRGDWTPYWEDGAGSSALETAVNRASSDRLSQAETIWAMLTPAAYPAALFEAAWRDVLLYSEHTWGAWCSISGPERKETKEQWDIKQSYAAQAEKQSRGLLEQALEQAGPASGASAMDIYNTTSWPRTDLVLLPRDLSRAGDRVTDDRGHPVASERLASGDLALIATEVPPFAARRFVVSAGTPFVKGAARAHGATLENGLLSIRVDEQTGSIVELRAKGISRNLVDTSSGQGLNDYLYLIGDNLADLKRNSAVKITVQEPGPLVASLLVQSDAPGCKQLACELRLVAGFDYVEIINLLDKQRLVAPSYYDKSGKESVNFGFAFNVPDGEMLLDVPLGAIRPERDQMPSACKNWFTVGRWADVANRDFGVTWITLDAPLVEVGGITATLLNSQTNPKIWRKKVERTQKLYSWAMNNHWGTNYRAYQEGPTRFRFVLRPHRHSSPADASRLAIGLSQPLLPMPSRNTPPSREPRLRVSNPDVLAAALKPSDDGKALMVRLFGASGRDARTRLSWSGPSPTRISLSDTSEKPIRPVGREIEVAAWEIVTLRADLP